MKDQPIANISESLLERIVMTDYGDNSHKVKETLLKIQSDSEAGFDVPDSDVENIINSDWLQYSQWLDLYR